VGPRQVRVLALAAELGISLYPSFCDGDDLLCIDGVVSRSGFDAATLDDVARVQAALEELAGRVPLEAPWDAPGARALDDETFDAWLVRSCGTEAGLRYWRMLVPGLMCTDAAQVSLLHFLFYIRSGHGIDHLVATRGGAQESRIAGGSQALATAMAQGLDVRLSCPVSEIRDGQVRFGDGLLRGARVVVAVPPPLAGRIRYAPALPWRRDQLMQQMPMGHVIKAQVRYASPFWRVDGLSGFALSTDGPVTSTFGTSPAPGGCGVLCAFVESDHALALSALPPPARRRAVIASLGRLFGAAATQPLEYFDMNWAEEEWSRGCFVGHFPPGAWTRYGSTLREPAGRIHWAGTETAERWNGYMDGAIRSGERAAAEVLAAPG
jgi:monoamine oxidase